ncbi:tetratricopeptide repeat protein [Fimbriiglobus ruber]|uniref:Putative tetratricopeptide repeat family protein n=1 Tax=Fimbriiglobus ruber TaxID=1908690 RepID=A0A225DU66_9BACT|nr:tetratricopeptide repeat protein [Fimbriiglobus ruber]OWK45060.1 putative tetratricopeptide repeat family protein [Fimbriiglobus ruber]
MTDPSDPAAYAAEHYLTVADSYADAGAFDRAVAVARRGVGDHPDDGRLWERLGVAAWACGDFPTAVHALETAEFLVPLRPLARLALTDAYLARGEVRSARRVLRTLDGAPDVGGDLIPHVAGRLFRAGAHTQAARIWRGLLRQNPGYAEGHYRYALCLWALNAEPEDLFIPLHEAVRLAPDVPTYALTLANVWVGVGSPRDAARILAGVDPVAVVCTGCLTRMTTVFRNAGDFDRAVACEARLTVLIATGRGSDPCPPVV